MSKSHAYTRAAARDLVRQAGPYVPGWFPLVAEPLHARIRPADPLQVVEIRGVRLELDVREYMQRRFFYHCYEAPEAAFLERWLRPGDAMVDVGAHIGFFSVLAAHLVGRTGAVRSFEPVPENFERLQRNAALNDQPQLHAVRAAVSNAPGEVPLGLPEERLLGTSTCDFTVGGEFGTVTAPATTLDAVWEELGDRPVRLLKLDVEGMEPVVLDGFGTALARRPPEAIMLEVNHKMLAKHGSGSDALLARLEAAGLEIRSLDRLGRLRPPPDRERVRAAAERWDAEHEPSSSLRVGLGTRHTMFNAVAVRPGVVSG